jgi:hypothetical protein
MMTQLVDYIKLTHAHISSHQQGILVVDLITVELPLPEGIAENATRGICTSSS